MIKYLAITLCIILWSYHSIAQHQLVEDNYKFRLLKEGVRKVEVYNKSLLQEVWELDSAALKIIVYYLATPDYSLVENAPEYSENLYTRNTHSFFYRNTGGVEKIVIVDYTNPIFLNEGKLVNVKTNADTTIFIYNYPLLQNWVMNRKLYHSKAGKQEFIEAEYYGYNNKGELILVLQDEGRVQYYFEYNKKGEIVKETIFGKIITYQYNKAGQKVKRISEDQEVEYEYNSQDYLIKIETSGKNPSEIKFKYY